MRKSIAVVIALLIPFCVAESATGAPHLNGQFETSGTPGRMAAGPDGEVWFTLSGSTEGKEFGRIDPDGTVTEYDAPNGLPVAAVDVRNLEGCQDTNGDNGNGVWMAQVGHLIRWNASSASGVVTSTPNLPDPADISVEGCGGFWVADRDTGLLYGSPGGPVHPFFNDVVTHADSIGPGTSGGDVSWSDPVTGTVNLARAEDDGDEYYWVRNEQTLDGSGIELSAGENPALDVIGKSGQFAFTNPGGSLGNAGTVGPMFDFQAVATPGADPLGIAPGHNGNYWIANRGSDDLTQITPTGIYRAGLGLPDGSDPSYLVSGTTGDLWVGLAGSTAIARISGIDPAPVRPEVSEIQASNEDGRTVVRFEASAAGQVRIAIRRQGNGRVIRQVKFEVEAGPNRLDLGEALTVGAYEATGTAFFWAPDWETRIEGWRETADFVVRGSLSRPKARVTVHGRKAILHYRFSEKTDVRIVVHRRFGRRLHTESVRSLSLPHRSHRYLIGKFPKGRYVVRFTRSVRLGQNEVVVSKPAIIRFRIRR